MLRVRPQSAAVALGIAVLPGMAETALATQEHNQVISRGSTAFVIAVAIGAGCGTPRSPPSAGWTRAAVLAYETGPVRPAAGR
ncbi:hypothetical protein [Streptomyces sp. XH2]|uniref:hypothetical protein n=1 Tax=Streptomyces sp. XH2 TaxID=3412483 RepID=UPI003C7B9C7E